MICDRVDELMYSWAKAHWYNYIVGLWALLPGLWRQLARPWQSCGMVVLVGGVIPIFMKSPSINWMLEVVYLCGNLEEGEADGHSPMARQEQRWKEEVCEVEESNFWIRDTRSRALVFYAFEVAIWEEVELGLRLLNRVSSRRALPARHLGATPIEERSIPGGLAEQLSLRRLHFVAIWTEVHSKILH